MNFKGKTALITIQKDSSFHFRRQNIKQTLHMYGTEFKVLVDLVMVTLTL